MTVKTDDNTIWDKGAGTDKSHLLLSYRLFFSLRSVPAGPVVAQQAFDLSVLEPEDYRDGNCYCDCINNILQPRIQRQEPIHDDLDSEIARKQPKQDEDENNGRTRTLTSGDFALQLP